MFGFASSWRRRSWGCEVLIRKVVRMVRWKWERARIGWENFEGRSRSFFYHKTESSEQSEKNMNDSLCHAACSEAVAEPLGHDEDHIGSERSASVYYVIPG